MVEEELHAINEVKDVSISLREFNKVKFTKDPQFLRGKKKTVR